MIDQVIESLKRMTSRDRERVVSALNNPDEASGPTLPAVERRQLAEDRVRLREEFEQQKTRLEREHEARLAEVVAAKQAVLASYEALEELHRSYRARRDAVEQQLLATRAPAIDAFIEEMHGLLEELPGLQNAVAFWRVGDAGMGTAADNRESLRRRRAAIEAAIATAERGLSFEALDADALARRLASLRESLPSVENIGELIAAAKRRRQGPVQVA